MRAHLPALVALALFAAESFAAPPSCLSQSVEGAASKGSSDDLRIFSATKIGDVTFRVQAGPGFEGNHLLEWRIFDRSGSLYQSISIPVGNAPGERVLSGHSRPVPVTVPTQVVVNGLRAPRIDQPFPIGGTMIQTNALYGDWRLEVYLDGEPFCKPYTFRITR